jgi:hypothetical protein
LEVPTRSDAEALQQTLDRFQPEVVRDDGVWTVALRPTAETAPELLALFDAIGRWLEDHHQASLLARFGERSLTIMRTSEARPTDSSQFLLERVIQLETALQSRISIEQAKGMLAERLKIGVEEAFEVLRGAARGAGKRLRDLAEDVVGSAELPEVIREFLQRSPDEEHSAARAQPPQADADAPVDEEKQPQI